MKVSAELIGMVKTNTKEFCKETIEKLTKYWPGGSYLMLRSKPMIPGDRPLIAIGYKYNARRVLSFIVTKNAGSTKTGIPYCSLRSVNKKPTYKPTYVGKNVTEATRKKIYMA